MLVLGLFKAWFCHSLPIGRKCVGGVRLEIYIYIFFLCFKRSTSHTEVFGYLNETCHDPYCDNFRSILTFFKYPKCPSPEITYERYKKYEWLHLHCSYHNYPWWWKNLASWSSGPSLSLTHSMTERVWDRREGGRDETSFAFHSPTVLCIQHSRRGFWVRGSKITPSNVNL